MEGTSSCVFDRDQNSNEALNGAKLQAKDNKIMLAYSNPAFEYWVLCHYEYYESQCGANKVHRLAKNKAGFDPKKEKELYKKTKDKLDTAKTNAKEIQKKHEGKGTELISRESNPSTSVYRILERIDDFKVQDAYPTQ